MKKTDTTPVSSRRALKRAEARAADLVTSIFALAKHVLRKHPRHDQG